MWLRAIGFVVVVATFAATGAFGVSSNGTITTMAGTGVQGFSGDGGPATSAQLRLTEGMAVDGQGNVYIADSHNYRVRKVSPGGTITTFAGKGAPGGAFPVDGSPATSARLDNPFGVAVDGQGNVYISDWANYRVYKVNPGGIIARFAGTGVLGFSGDGGPATSARLYAPAGLAVDGQGNVYIADAGNNRVRKVSPGGTITTFAGNGKQGFSGDGGPATSATMTSPERVATDSKGNVYIAVNYNYRVRKVSRGGTITTFAGGGSSVGDGGPATSAGLRDPRGVAVDGQGNVYIADFSDHRVRKVSPGGTITTFAGTGTGGFSGDGGPATSARLNGPDGLAVDGQGNVYIGDSQSYRVRKVATSATATRTYAGFYSPSRNLSCEMADRDARGSYVYCQSVKSPKNVRMSLDGRLKICRGTKCLGNPAENTPTLGYGRKMTIGRFACSSQKSGVKCRVVRSGKGFLISRTGVRRVGR
jgi:sugar lactone lactonase YvrE